MRFINEHVMNTQKKRAHLSSAITHAQEVALWRSDATPQWLNLHRIGIFTKGVTKCHQIQVFYKATLCPSAVSNTGAIADDSST